jgi:chemotaxis protein methyltransferase CheR
LKAADFDFLAQLMSRRSGVALQRSKTLMIADRLEGVVRRFGFRTIEAMLAELRFGPEQLVAAVVEALLIADTAFFRDPALFEHVRQNLLPALVKAKEGERRLRIWCAGASTGQEPYSLAMILNEENLARDGWHVELIATDLSTAALTRAREGLFSRHEMERGLSPQMLVKFFVQQRDSWRIEERIRRMVSFRAFNLLDDFGWLGTLDAIFCRNVLIYFDARTKASVLAKLSEALAPHGCLILGASESLTPATDLLRSDASRIVYRHAA